MRLSIKILLGICLAVIVGLAGVYIFLFFNGRRIFNEQASALTQRKVTVQTITPAFPAGIEVRGLEIEGLARVKMARVNIDLKSLVKREIKFISAEIEEPAIFVTRSEEGTLNIAPPAGVQAAAPSVVTAPLPRTGPSPEPQRSVILKRLRIRNGQVQFKDQKSSREYVIERITGEAKNVSLTGESVRTNFLMTASLVQMNLPFVGHIVKASGWLNWVAKDMEAKVQAMDDDGRIGLDATLSSRANDMSVQESARLAGSQPKQASGKKSGLVEAVVLGAIGKIGTEIEAKFSFHTKMDRVEIGRISLTGNLRTGLQSSGSSGNIVDDLKALGQELLGKKETVPTPGPTPEPTATPEAAGK